MIQPNYVETALVPYVPIVDDAKGGSCSGESLLDRITAYFYRKRFYYLFSVIAFFAVSSFCFSLCLQSDSLTKQWFAAVAEEYEGVGFNCFLLFSCFGHTVITRALLFLSAFTVFSRVACVISLLRIFAFSSVFYCVGIRVASAASFLNASVFTVICSLQVLADICFSAEAFGFYGNGAKKRSTFLFCLCSLGYAALYFSLLYLSLGLLFS